MENGGCGETTQVTRGLSSLTSEKDRYLMSCGPCGGDCCHVTDFSDGML